MAATVVVTSRPVFRLPRGSEALRHLLLLSFGFLIAFPFIWMLLTSFKPFEETLLSPPTVLPLQWRPSNYAEAWRAANFPRFFMNSALVSSATVIGTLVTSVLAG